MNVTACAATVFTLDSFYSVASYCSYHGKTWNGKWNEIANIAKICAYS